MFFRPNSRRNKGDWMYIFGYGSLINKYSRNRTGNTGKSYPVLVNGLQRAWGNVDGSYPIAPLVVKPGKGVCNGVLIEVDEQGLRDFDQREHGYQRIQISAEQIELLENTDLTITEPVWVYINTRALSPCEQYPITQTYVDTVIAGCLSVSYQFAEMFVATTSGWQHPYCNDRHKPKYGNLAGVDDNARELIDLLIEEVMANSLAVKNYK